MNYIISREEHIGTLKLLKQKNQSRHFTFKTRDFFDGGKSKNILRKNKIKYVDFFNVFFCFNKKPSIFFDKLEGLFFLPFPFDFLLD